MKLVNLTPHTLNLLNKEGSTFEVAPSGEVARVASTSVEVGSFDLGGGFELPLFETSFGEVVGMPEPVEGTVFVVSSMVLEALKGSRNDVWAPGAAQRDTNGVVVGALGAQRKKF